MSMRRLLLPSLTALALVCGSLGASGQTGPLTDKGKTADTGPGVPKQGQVGLPGLSVEKVAKLLEAKGAQTSTSNSQNTNGKYTVVQAKMQANNFQYDFVVVFANFNNGNKVWYLSASLNPNSKNLTADQLHGLLKENYLMSGDNFFMIDPQTGAVMLQSGRYALNFSDDVFERQVNVYLDDIRATYKLWAPAQ